MDKSRQKKIIKMSFRVDEQLRSDYKVFCETNGYSLSRRLRLFMEKDMEYKIIINNDK